MLLIRNNALDFEKVGTYENASDFIKQISAIMNYFSRRGYKSPNDQKSKSGNNYELNISKYAVNEDDQDILLIIRAYTRNLTEYNELWQNPEF